MLDDNTVSMPARAGATLRKAASTREEEKETKTHNEPFLIQRLFEVIRGYL